MGTRVWIPVDDLIRHRDEVAERDGLAAGEAGGYVPVQTPMNERRLTRLPRRRKYRFVKRLLCLANEALRHPVAFSTSKESVLPTIQSRVFGAACANCGGQCCVRGGTHAYLDANAVWATAVQCESDEENQAVRKVSSQQVVAEYLQFVPEFSYEDSCVFHSEHGCTLPREMRSATCNRTICGGLVEIQNRFQLDQQHRFFLVAAKRGGIRGTRFVDGESPESEGCQMLPPTGW